MTDDSNEGNNHDDETAPNGRKKNPCATLPASSSGEGSAKEAENGPDDDDITEMAAMCLDHSNDPVDVRMSADKESRDCAAKIVAGNSNRSLYGDGNFVNLEGHERFHDESILPHPNPDIVAQINRRQDGDDLEEEGEVEDPQENGGREMQPAIELDEGEELALALAVIRRQEMFTRPGAYFVPGINYRPPGSTSDLSAANGFSTEANGMQNPTSPAEETKEEIILEGFLAPEPGRNTAVTSRRRSASSQNHSSNPNRDSPEETMEERVERIKQHLLANAITLDDSAVKTIPMRRRQSRTDEGHESIENAEEGEEAEDGNARNCVGGMWKRIKRSWMDASFLRRTIFLIAVALLCAALVILGVMFGTTNNSTTNFNQSTPATYEDPCNGNGNESSQLEGHATIRWNVVRDMISSITPEHVLLDETSPQAKALRWIVCHDAISAKFLNQHDVQTANVHIQDANIAQPSLSKRTQTTSGYGFLNSGNTPKSHILRRYILATLHYSTSLYGPWQDDWNFLNGNEHECSWHKIYNRSNFQFGDMDPAGIVCQKSVFGDVLLNDEEFVVERLTVNFRIKNNLTGTLPPELGHLVDIGNLLIEQQEHLTGSLPPMMPKLTLLESVGILFNGPDFGGEIPVSLLELPSLSYLNIKQNAGSWSLPDNVDSISPKLTNLEMSHSNFRGTIPRWIYESNVAVLDLSFNELHGPMFLDDETFQSFPRIEFLNYHGNRHLYGTLPDALGRLGGTLKVLALGDNQIGGSLPESIGNLSNLEVLSLNDNVMTGTLPAALANMTSLRHLVLSSNSFRGSVNVLESMKNLTSLLIHANKFSGTLPGGIFGVSSDASLYLDVGNNRFSGDIPPSYGNLPNLAFFGAARNNFNYNAADKTTCENVEFTIMDCSACSCCSICCDSSDSVFSSDICDFHMDTFSFLGLDCGSWWKYCNKPQTYYDVDPV